MLSTKKDVLRILLVEDDKEQAWLVQRTLTQHDARYNVTVAEGEKDCLAALAQENYGLVLLDYRLPDTSGLDILHRLRQMGYTMPAVMMTAHGDETVAVEAMKAGAADYVIKEPGYLTRLPPIIDQALRRHRLATELAAAQQRYRLLFESSREAILVLDRHDRIIEINPSAESLLGAPRDQVVGGRLFDWVQSEPPEQLVAWHQQFCQRQPLSETTFSIVNRTAQRFWIEISGAWLTPPTLGQYQLYLRDVTQARRDRMVWEALNRAALAAHNALDPMSIYQAVAHVLLELGLSSSLWWLDEDRQALQVRHTTYAQQSQDEFASRTGLDVENLWVPVDRMTVFRDRVRYGETVYLQDTRELVRQIVDTDDPQLISWVVDEFQGVAAIMLPLVIADKVAGTMLIHGAVSERDMPAAQAFAAQISSALEHARLYEDARRRINELAALQEISFRLGSALEIQPLMQTITEVALDLTQANNCHIYLIGDEGFEFVAARRRDGSTEPAVQQPRPAGLVAQVARQGQPLFINNAREHPLYQSPEAKAWGVEAIAGCPLLRGGQVLGVFTLTYVEPHHFDAAERSILNLLADQAAVAVETAQLYQDLRKHNQDLSTLYQLALAVSAQVNISDVLEVAYQTVYKATGADTFAVGLYVASTDELVYVMIREEGQDVSHHNLPVSDGEGLTAWVVRNRQELIIEDLLKDELPVPGVTVGVPRRSWMGFPLIAGERLVGVMSVQSGPPAAFDEAHQTLCRNIATHVAIALEKARLLEETQQRNWELATLNKVSAAVSHSFDLKTLLDGALDIILEEMVLDAGSFHLLDEEKAELALMSYRNFSAEAVEEVSRIPLGEGICGHVALSGDPIVIDDYGRDARSLSKTLGKEFSSLATVPLASKDAVVGTLSVLDRSPRQLTPREIGLLVAVGQQIGIAVENTLLYRKTVDRERRLARLYEAARSLSSVLQAPQLLDRILATVMSELPAMGVRLWLRDESGGLQIHRIVGKLLAPEDTDDSRLRAEIEQVLEGQEGVLWSRRGRPLRWAGAAMTGKRGYRAAVPLRGQASEVGVLEVAAAGGKDWLTSSDVEFLSTLAGIAAIAHENAQLYEALAQYAISLEAKVEARTAEVRREKEQTEAILRSVADAIFVLDSRSEILLSNPAGEALLNTSSEDRENLRAFLRQVTQQPASDAPGPTITVGTKTLQARAARIRHDLEELGSVIVLRDVTHFKEVNRLKSQFVSTVSHELRTPLSNLKLYLSLLERGKAERRAEYQRVLGHEVNRLENLIQDLLDLSRLESHERVIQKDRIDLSEIASHVLTVLQPQADANRVLLVNDYQPDQGQLWVRANREQMVQMTMNLVANAINYTQAGGVVTVNLGRQEDQEGNWVIMSVEDTGVGIAADDLPRIFDRFFRGQVQQHMSAGTGLGLAIVKEILKHHGGWITVKSQVDRGSLFTVGLPAFDDA